MRKHMAETPRAKNLPARPELLGKENHTNYIKVSHMSSFDRSAAQLRSPKDSGGLIKNPSPPFIKSIKVLLRARYRNPRDT